MVNLFEFIKNILDIKQNSKWEYIKNLQRKNMFEEVDDNDKVYDNSEVDLWAKF